MDIMTSSGLSVLNFIGSSYCPPLLPHCLPHSTPAFSIPLDVKFGGFFLYF